MGKKIIKQLQNTMSSFIVFKKQVFPYYGKSKLYANNSIKLEDLINDKDLFATIMSSDFNKFSFVSEFEYEELNRDNLIEYLINRKTRLDDDEINIYRELKPKDISSFYKFEVTIELDGVLIEPGRYMQYLQYPDDLIVLIYNKEHLYLSRKEIPAPMEARSKAHLVPKEKVNKVIGKKRFKKTKWIGTEKEDEFTGKEEVFVLDLNNFNQDVYAVFKEHEAIEVLHGFSKD